MNDSKNINGVVGSSEIEQKLVDVYKNMSCPDVFFLFEPTSTLSEVECERQAVNFLSDFSDHLNNNKKTFKGKSFTFAQVDENSFKLR